MSVLLSKNLSRYNTFPNHLNLDPACGDLPIVKCTYSPCAQLLCNDNVNATCRENFCGGCNAEFYLGEEKIECSKLCLNIVVTSDGLGVRLTDL